MIPPELWSWTAIVTDPENVRKQAARHLRLTKAKKKEGMDPTSANTENTPPAAPLEGALEGLQPQATCDPPSFELPHFERAPQRKSKPRLKVKAKPAVANKKEPSNGPGVSPLMNVSFNDACIILLLTIQRNRLHLRCHKCISTLPMHSQLCLLRRTILHIHILAHRLLQRRPCMHACPYIITIQ